MCKTYPGPKCGKHLTEQRAKLEERTSTFTARIKKASDEMEKARLHLSELLKHPETTKAEDLKARTAYEKAIERYDRATNAQRNHASLLRVNAIEFDQTLDGIAALEDEVIRLADVCLPTEACEKRLEEAQEAYKKQVLAYDKLHGTVNFKVPAQNYDEEGIQALKDKIKVLDKKISHLYGEILKADSVEQEEALTIKQISLVNKKESLEEKIAHCRATQERIRLGFLPDPLGADKHRKEAAHALKRQQESYERSDTDGALSQWASGITADGNRLKAEIAEQNGKSRFRALFDLNGNYVMAKPVIGKFGPTWGVYENPEDPDRFAKFVNESKSKDEAKQATLLLKKGYTMGLIMAPAYVTSYGESLVSVRNIILQDFYRTSKDTIEVLTANLYTHPVD